MHKVKPGLQFICLFVTLLTACRHAPQTVHFAVTESGAATQVVANGTVLQWDLNSPGYSRYVVQFLYANPCASGAVPIGTPGSPARCLVDGQLKNDLSLYPFKVCIEVPDPSDTPAGESCDSRVKGGQFIFKISNCPLCPTSSFAGIEDAANIPISAGRLTASQSTQPAPTQTTLPPPASGATPPPPSPSIRAEKPADPREQDVSCLPPHSQVTVVSGSPFNPPTYPQGQFITWMQVGKVGELTISFPKGSPCQDPLGKGQYTCKLIGDPTQSPFTYILSAAECTGTVTSQIVVTK